MPLKDLGLPTGVRIGTIYRDDKIWIAGAEDQLQLDDRITLIGRREDIVKIMDRFQRKAEARQSVFIAGGGETGYHLASSLNDRRYSVTLMETDPQRCEFLANSLPHVTVVQADATRRAVLEEERVAQADVFAACTGDDENNIMACVEAKELGTKRMMAIVQRPDYANIVGKLGIDLAVSPRDVMAKQILSFLNLGAVISRNLLPGGRIGVYELEVNEGVPATRFDLSNLRLPPACLIVAVMRHEFVRVPGANDRLQAWRSRDHAGGGNIGGRHAGMVPGRLHAGIGPRRFPLSSSSPSTSTFPDNRHVTDMNLRLLAKHLGTICLLIGGTMLFSLPWALPQLGHRNDLPQIAEFERDGFLALIYSMLISAVTGGLLKWYGGRAQGKLYRREAMAIVGLSWIGATLLGGLPFYLSDTYRGPVRASERAGRIVRSCLPFNV